VDGEVTFFDGAAHGVCVDVQLGRNTQVWAEGRAIRSHGYSDKRTQPFYCHCGVCGGCQWQRVRSEQQLIHNQKQVSDKMQRIGKIILPEMPPILGAEATRFYRNKIEYTFGNKRYLTRDELGDESVTSQQDVAGFHARGLFDKVVDIDTCYLQAEPTNL